MSVLDTSPGWFLCSVAPGHGLCRAMLSCYCYQELPAPVPQGQAADLLHKRRCFWVRRACLLSHHV